MTARIRRAAVQLAIDAASVVLLLALAVALVAKRLHA